MENAYHFTNEWAGMPVKLGKLARYFGKLEVIVFFITITIQINSPLNFHLYIQNMVSYLPLRYVPNTI